MLRFVDDYFGAGIKGDVKLITVTRIRRNEWVGHTENYMILFRYKMGILSMNMAETENDLFFNAGKVIAAQDNFDSFLDVITFQNILNLLEWECDDWFE